MRSLLALLALGAVTACAGQTSSTSIPATGLQQSHSQPLLTCRFKRSFVSKKDLRQHKNGVVVHTFNKANAYVTYEVRNHLRNSAVNVWPIGDQSATITVQPHTATGIMPVSPPQRGFVVQKVSPGSDPGSGVELNGKICAQT